MAGRCFHLITVLRGHVLAVAVAVSGLFWVGDAMVHIAAGDERFVQHLFSAQAHTIVPRLITVALVLSIGLQLRSMNLRRMSEAKVRASERRFRTLTGSAPAGIFECDASGAWTYVNERGSELLGLSASEALGEGYVQSIHEADLERMRERWAVSVREGGRFREECRFSRRDASVVWTICEAAAHFDDDGAVAGFIGTITDITERVRAAAELAERIRLAELSAAVGVILAEEPDLDGMLERCAGTMVARLDVLLARIWLYDPAEDLLVLRASAGLYTHRDGPHARIPLGSQKIGVIAADRKPQLTNHIAGDPLVTDQEWARREGIVAFAGNPLVVGAALVGVMGVFSRQPILSATGDWLAAVAGKIALGIQRKQAEDEIRRAGERWAKTFDAMPDLVFTVASDYRITNANRALQARVGMERDAIVGRHCYEIMHGASEPPAVCPHRLAKVDGREHSAEIHEPHLGGDFFLSVSPIVNAVGCPAGVVHVVRDISERRQLEQRLEAAAYTDELTGLFNRRGFFTLAGKQAAVAQRVKGAVGLVYIDLDRFKAINDRWGHKEGDRALKDVAGILRQTFRESDILGRIGGDEFVVFISEFGHAGTERVLLANLRKRLDAHNAVADRPYLLEFSAGMARCAPGIPCRIEELLLRADRAMYREKRLGAARGRPGGKPVKPVKPGPNTRLNSRVPLEGVTLDLTPGGRAEVVDISSGGVCLRTGEPLPIRGRFDFQIPGCAEDQNFAAEVIWAEQIDPVPPDLRRFRSGLRFLEPERTGAGTDFEQGAGHS